MQVRAAVSPPRLEVKEDAWERINGDGYGSLYLTNAAMSGFNWHSQRDLLTPFVERYFDAVPHIFRTKDKEFAMDYFRAMFPGYRVERPILERSEQLLREAGGESPVLERMIREANDDLGRSIRCREFAASGD
jgi:aminopeptidase N